MKSPLLISLSALALLVLLAVQYIFITETYNTKRDLVNSRYKGTIREALSGYSSMDISYEFDSVLFVLDNLAVEYLFADPDTLNKSAIEVFQDVLADYKETEDYVRDYVRKTGLDPDFSYHLQITELYLKDMDYEIGYKPDSAMLSSIPGSALMVGSHTHVRNFFKLSYNTYINFNKRVQLVLNEMWLIMSLTIFMLVLVFTVFYLTLRNMLRQKRLSEMKTDFINNMTHELKTPLSTISVASSTLGNKAMIRKEERVEELSGIIKKQNRHLSDLIDRILDINIWERDQVKLKTAETAIEAWIKGLADDFRLKHSEVELDLNLDVQHLKIYMDEVHMSTAINNLLSNAVKYGNIPCRIQVDLRATAAQMEISISDNGPGIKREEQKHVFEKFYRGKESKERVIRGLGLGLYYVKQIAEAHGGSIAVKSEPGSGASFKLIIPI